MGIYLFTLFFVLFFVYRPARVPPYFLVLLVLSKRIHSVYMLRMFNDVISTLFSVFAVAALQRRLWSFSAVILSIAVSVKMNSLLYLPGAALIYLQALGPVGAFVRAAVPFLAVQFAVAVPFISAGYQKEYFSQAFEFSRVFFYKWTVNWRFVPEAIFLSKPFALVLLGAQLLLITAFCVKRGYHWLAPIKVPKIFSAVPPSTSELPALVRALLNPSHIERTQRLARITPEYVLTTLVTSNLIGILCARSLHYQFYSWYFWTIPYVLSKVTPVFGHFFALVAFASQEFAWNTYPSTNTSSAVLVGCNFALVAALYVQGQLDGRARERREEEERNTKIN